MTVAQSPEPSDQELVRRAQNGDEAAFAVLVDRNRRAVFKAALAGVGSAAEADDVAQEAFVTAYRKLAGFRGDAQFRTWLLAITWRKALDRRRSISRWLRMTSSRPAVDDGPGEPMERVADTRRSHEEDMMSAETRRLIRRLIASLPGKLRDTLLLAGSGEYSYEQIASMLNIPIGTVKWRVSEARRVLKQKLAASELAGDEAARAR